MTTGFEKDRLHGAVQIHKSQARIWANGRSHKVVFEKLFVQPETGIRFFLFKGSDVRAFPSFVVVEKTKKIRYCIEKEGRGEREERKKNRRRLISRF